ncbi:Hypothetical predicted protein [Pelobates cultripes]|uniref:Uncharacterized protein n=1 Tax=Pelobates cultripes TaxID=61616 RepID=A0AAD1R182_PELCU|nr:Hypothetical predicted protein [Pelobates cultripes]
MADGRDADSKQQTVDSWAATIRAKFNAVCQKWWEQLVEKNLPPAPTPATMASHQRAPLRAQPRCPNKSSYTTGAVKRHIERSDKGATDAPAAPKQRQQSHTRENSKDTPQPSRDTEIPRG